MRLGSEETTRIVVYDNSPLRTAARGWFHVPSFRGPTGSRSSMEDSRNASRGPRGRERRGVAKEMPGSDAIAANDVIDKAQLLAGCSHPDRRCQRQGTIREANRTRAPTSRSGMFRAREEPP